MFWGPNCRIDRHIGHIPPKHIYNCQILPCWLTQQRRARWIFRGRDKNQEWRTFKSWFKQESRIFKSSRISAVKNQEYFSNFLDFKQESRKGKSKFLISSGSRDLNFGKRQQIQARIKIFQKNTLSLNLKTYIFSN